MESALNRGAEGSAEAGVVSGTQAISGMAAWSGLDSTGDGPNSQSTATAASDSPQRAQSTKP